VTVYVDNYRAPAQVGKIRGRWSHLYVGPADDLAELHAFAISIGLRREWFQDKVLPHYDVTDTRRELAIKAGARSVSWRETGEFVSGWRKARAMREAASQNGLTGNPTTDDESGRSLIDQSRKDEGTPHGTPDRHQ
jgi:hypothetical protein